MDRGRMDVAVPYAPKRIRSERVSPVKTIDYKRDISPYERGFGIALGSALLGLCFIALMFFQVPIPIYLAPIFVGLIGYGVGRGGILLFALREQLFGAEETETTEQVMEDTPSPQNVYWVNLGTTTARLPQEPRVGALREFAQAIISGKASFSELGGTDMLGAKDFGYSTNSYNDLRDVFLRNNLAYWKNKEFTQQGVQITQRGMKALEAIANGNLGTAEDYLSS